MSFNEGVRSDSGRVRTSSGSRSVGTLGGGSILGLITVLALSYFTGYDLTFLLNGGDSRSVQESPGISLSHCQTGADANAHTECRMVVTADSLDRVWETQLAQQNDPAAYEYPGFTVFSGSVSTGCGTASSAVGPFYCPRDKGVYLDLSFFEQMERDLGAANAPLAQEYVVAHEWGHHIQNLQGVFNTYNTHERGEDGPGVRSELQADCYAGVWMHWASTTIDPDSGVAFLKRPTEEEIAQAMQTARAIGDDRIQERYQGKTNPESWSHGSAEQRQRWLMRGMEQGSIAACNTWEADSL